MDHFPLIPMLHRNVELPSHLCGGFRELCVEMSSRPDRPNLAPLNRKVHKPALFGQHFWLVSSKTNEINRLQL